MGNDQGNSLFADDADTATQILQGLISPAPAQALVAPPPDSPPPTRPGESTPVTGSLAGAPSQATPRVARAPLPPISSPSNIPARAAQLEQVRNADAARFDPDLDPNQQQYRPALGTKIRRGLAAYFSGGTGGAVNANTNAPNNTYAIDEANRQGRLGQDEANLADLNKSYQSSLKQAKNAITPQRNNLLQQARQQNAGIRQQLADARQEAADAQRQLAQAKMADAVKPTGPSAPAAPGQGYANQGYANQGDANQSGANQSGANQNDTGQGDNAGYVKVLSNGQVGYMPKANLAKAQQRDKNLKVLK